MTPKVIDGAPRLFCELCKKSFSASNPLRTGSDHLGAKPSCPEKQRMQKLDAANSNAASNAASGSASGKQGSGAEPAAKRLRTLEGFLATAEQQRDARNALARFFYKNNVALHLVEDADLRAAS